MEKWGYVRLSFNRDEQAAGWEDQIATLKTLGCDRFFYEEASTRKERPEFQRMISDAIATAGPRHRICLVAAKMDRAFRDLSAADDELPNL